MRRILAFCLLIAVAIMLAVPQVLAQSGVLSGPPQVSPGPGPSGPSMPPGQPMPPGQRVAWIAVAGGFDGNGRRVGVGFSGHHDSRIDAEDAALRACNRYGNDIRCRNPLAVSTGCLYIVPGSGSRGVTWGTGGTREGALQECRRGGYSCSTTKIIGGCLPGNDN